MEQRDYWSDCVAEAAHECDLVLTQEQLECLANAAERGHNHYEQAFYSPSWSERFSEIEDESKAKLKKLQSEFDEYKRKNERKNERTKRLHTDSVVFEYIQQQVARDMAVLYEAFSQKPADKSSEPSP